MYNYTDPPPSKELQGFYEFRQKGWTPRLQNTTIIRLLSDASNKGQNAVL